MQSFTFTVPYCTLTLCFSRTSDRLKCILSGGGSPLYCSLPVVCVLDRGVKPLPVWLFWLPRAGRLSRPADSLSRCSSTGRPCHCSIPTLLCPAPLSTSLPTPNVLLFLCRCWEGSPLNTTQWQNSPTIYISISLLIYLFSWVFLECC